MNHSPPTTTHRNGGQPCRDTVEGWLIKRGNFIHARRVWKDRYFVLQGRTLSYYIEPGDIKAKGTFFLDTSCQISDIIIYPSKKENGSAPSKKSNKENERIFYIKITWPESMLRLLTEVKDEIDPMDISLDVPQLPILTPPDSPATPPNGQVTEDNYPDSPPMFMHSTEDRDSIRDKSKSPRFLKRPRLHLQRMASDTHLSPPPPHQTQPLRNLVEVPHYPSCPNLEEEPTDGIQRHYEQQLLAAAQATLYREQALKAMRKAEKKKKLKKTSKRIMQGSGVAAVTSACLTATVVSVGVGLVPALMFAVMSAVASGSGAMAGRRYFKNQKSTTLVLASSDFEEIQKWKAALTLAISGEMSGKNGNVPNGSGVVASAVSATADTDVVASEKDCFYSQPGTSWKPLEGGWSMLMGSGAQGLRIFQEEEVIHSSTRAGRKGVGRIFHPQLSVKGRPRPPLKTQLILNATPLNAFMMLMSHSRVDNNKNEIFRPQSEQRASFRIIETMNDHMDVIHVVFRPLYLFPFWTKPRDFCLFRYWRYEDNDGSYIICYDSVQHDDCPPNKDYVRGELHGVISIAPPRKQRRAAGTVATTENSECLLTYIVQVDPRGWVPTMPLPVLSNQGYAEAFAISALLQMLDVRDALDHDRFISVSLDDIHPPIDQALRLFNSSSASATTKQQTESQDVQDNMNDLVNYDFSYASLEISQHSTTPPASSSTRILQSPSIKDFTTIFTPLHTNMWAEPDANSFMVRGKTYKKDRKKINAGCSILRLLLVDCIEVAAPIMTGMCSHPNERVQTCLKNNISMPPFVICINIVLPGPPHYHMVMYYGVDDVSLIDGSANTPFSILAKDFFLGQDDEFRDNTFKLIPQIVEGNFLVRKAVGSTPAIMGTKLKQHYFQGDRYFELLLDVGSSSVATGVVRLSTGYAKTVVVDMAFLLEGNDESTLPEMVMGCCRLKNVDFSAPLRFCESLDAADYSNGI